MKLAWILNWKIGNPVKFRFYTYPFEQNPGWYTLTLPFHIFDGQEIAGALPSPCCTWRGKIFGKMFALIFPNTRVIFWSLIKIVPENPIVAVI